MVVSFRCRWKHDRKGPLPDFVCLPWAKVNTFHPLHLPRFRLGLGATAKPPTKSQKEQKALASTIRKGLQRAKRDEYASVGKYPVTNCTPCTEMHSTYRLVRPNQKWKQCVLLLAVELWFYCPNESSTTSSLLQGRKGVLLKKRKSVHSTDNVSTSFWKWSWLIGQGKHFYCATTDKCVGICRKGLIRSWSCPVAMDCNTGLFGFSFLFDWRDWRIY